MIRQNEYFTYIPKKKVLIVFFPIRIPKNGIYRTPMSLFRYDMTVDKKCGLDTISRVSSL